MSREQSDPARRGDTRATLLAAAEALLDDGGMAAVTLRAVGERAGVSRQAPYRHFADKVDLLSVLTAGYFRRLREEVDAAAGEGGGGAVARLGAMSAAYVRFGQAAPERYRLMFGPEMRASLHAAVHDEARALGERYVRVIAAGQEAGELAGSDPLEIAGLLYATSHGAVDLALAGHLNKVEGINDPLRTIRLLLRELDRGSRNGGPGR
jgi:AcrR family transcriptional regulator